MTPHRCDRCRVLALAAGEDRWPPGTVVTTYLFGETVPAGLAAADVAAAIYAAAAAWSRVCGVAFAPAARPEDARVLVYFGPIDGPWNILGETELPADGVATAHHRMELDGSEQWTPAFVAGVILHEMGHAIGIGHAPAPIDAVMAPVYDPAHTAPLAWDVARAVERYGPPAAAPTPAPESVTIDPITVTITVPDAGTYAVTFTPTEARKL